MQKVQTGLFSTFCMSAAWASKAKGLATSKAFCYSEFRAVNSVYRLTMKKQAIRALQKMLRQNALRIRRALDRLAEDPDRRDVDIAPLEGRPAFRLRVGGSYVNFERVDRACAIDVLRIAPRGQAYRQQENSSHGQFADPSR